MITRFEESPTDSQIVFIAENVADGHTLGYISDLLYGRMISRDHVEYVIAPESLLLLLTEFQDRKNQK